MVGQHTVIRSYDDYCIHQFDGDCVAGDDFLWKRLNQGMPTVGIYVVVVD